MRKQIVNSDPGDEQQQLFTVDGRLYCKSCRTARASLCRHDADLRHEEIERTMPRPWDCLNSPQNRDGIPY